MYLNPSSRNHRHGGIKKAKEKSIRKDGWPKDFLKKG